LKESILWRGELKLPTVAFRALLIVIVACASNLLTTNVFAQEGLAHDVGIEDETAIVLEAPAVDSIAAVEQSLLLGEDGPTAQTGPAASILGVFRIILTLAVVAVAIYGLVFFIKRASRGGKARDPFLKILATIPLGANRSAHIISAGSKAWLVGVAEHGINLISEIEDKDLLNTMLMEDSRKSSTPDGTNPTGRLPDFRSLLRRFGISAGSSDDTVTGPDGIRKRREKLKGF
jgi:flagellar protein FliO/FliZ